MAKSRKSTELASESNRMMRQQLIYSKEAKEKGIPIAWLGAGDPVELMYAMGIVPLFPENYSTLCAAKGVAPKYCDIAESAGFRADLCSYVRNTIGHVLNTDEQYEGPYGGLTKPDFLLISSQTCDIRVNWFQALSELLNIPLFIIDVPYDSTTRDGAELKDHWLDYYVSQLGDLIEFVEHHTAARFDYDRFKRVVEISEQTRRISQEIVDLRKARPCPFGSSDAFSSMVANVFFAGTPEALDYYKRLKIEVKKKVAAKEGVIPEEKFRLLWGGIPFWFDLSVFNYFEPEGGVVVTEDSWHFPREMDTNDPFRGLAIKYVPGVPNSTIGSSITRAINLAKEFEVDGAILSFSMTCRPIYITQLEMKNALEKECGIPVVVLESDFADARNYSEEQIKLRLDAFKELIVEKKKGA